jgi:predicted O-methyltransferase YrrM
MDADTRAVLAQLQHWGRENDARHQDRSQKMLNLHPDTAHLVSILICASRRRHLLEIGTSNGYGTIWLAWSARKTQGRVISIDRSADKLKLADENLRRAGLRDVVNLQHGDATEIVRSLPGPFDLVFFDADRVTAPTQFQILLPKLTSDVLVLSDNALSHPEEIAPYLALFEARPEFEHTIVPVGNGLSLAYRMSAIS